MVQGAILSRGDSLYWPRDMIGKTDAREFSRTLVYVPIVHTQADMGLLGKSIRRAHLYRMGKTLLKRKVAAIDQIWADI